MGSSKRPNTEDTGLAESKTKKLKSENGTDAEEREDGGSTVPSISSSDKKENPSKKKRNRTRVRKLHEDLKNQLEFYFSDANLRKDRYMKELVSTFDNGWVPVEEFVKFNKIKVILEKKGMQPSEIPKAVKDSQIIEVNEGETAIRRDLAKNPVTEKDSTEVDECTVYVEGLPPFADVPWLRNTFSDFGAIEYVSLPRKPNGSHKGFGFIEFKQKNGAENACKFNNLKSGRVAPDQVKSDGDQRKRGGADLAQMGKLHVISKLEWIRLKEQYAELRKKNANIAKQYLKTFSNLESKISQPGVDQGEAFAPEHEREAEEIAETPKDEQKTEEVIEQHEATHEELAEESEQYDKGCIVKITFKEKLLNSMKNKIREIPKVVYVDLIEGDTEAFIRFDCSQSASACLDNPSSDVGELTILCKTLLEGEEEQAYWRRVSLMRGKKRNRVKDKQRGKQRLQGRYEKHLIKVEENLKVNKHIVFGD